MPDDKLVDPDCRNGKHRSCVGALCQCSCHWAERSEVAHLEALQEIAWLEHSTQIIPLGSDPTHCGTCARIVGRVARLRKESA